MYSLKLIIGHGAQIAVKSWWPLQSTWMESDHNFGRWTASNELWYQGHRQKILAGKAQPITMTKWREQLRMRDPRLIHKNVEKYSEEFLRSHHAGL
jgi:hypothetical protein